MDKQEESREVKALREFNLLIKDDLLLYIWPLAGSLFAGTAAIIYYGGWVKGIAFFIIFSLWWKIAAKRFNKKLQNIYKTIPGIFTENDEDSE